MRNFTMPGDGFAQTFFDIARQALVVSANFELKGS